MRMTIINHWLEDRRFDGTRVPPKTEPPVDMGETGYQSVKEMQKELIRRFPHEEPIRITNGIMYTKLPFKQIQFVTLHD